MRRSDDAHNPSKISAIKSTDAANANTILASSAAEDQARQQDSASPDTTILPAIIARTDAIDAANCLNQLT